MFLLLFWLLIGWGLYDGSLYFRDAAIWGSIWLVFFLGFLFFPGSPIGMVCIGAIALMAMILLIKFVGNPSVT